MNEEVEITLNKLGEIIEQQAKRIRGLEGRLKTWHSPENLQTACRVRDERIKDLEAALLKINNWAKAYPLKMFPEPDFKKANKVLKAAGLSLDAISASNMRHVINRVKKIVEQAL